MSDKDLRLTSLERQHLLGLSREAGSCACLERSNT